MLVPLNQIQQNQYTAGSEFVIKLTNASYQGYYCILGGNSYFTGKIISNSSIGLTKLEVKSVSQINNVVLTSSARNLFLRYFLSKKNTNPILIIEVNENSFKSFKNNALYYSVSILSTDIYENSPNLDRADSQMPGLKIFLFS